MDRKSGPWCECASDTSRQEMRPATRTFHSEIPTVVLVFHIVWDRRDAAVMPLNSAPDDTDASKDCVVIGDLSLYRTVLEPEESS